MANREHRPVAAITGAAQGIGRRTAVELAERGYALALCDLRPCAETLAEVRGLGAEAIECVGDVSDDAVAAAFAAAAPRALGRRGRPGEQRRNQLHRARRVHYRRGLPQGCSK